MLTLLTGRSRRLWPHVLAEMGEAHAAGAERLLLITPDQYTLQAELDLVDQLNLPGLLRIEVLSPSRLRTRVFSLAGSPQRVRIDGRGKAMVLAEVLRTSKDDLIYYRGAAGRRGFAEQLAVSIAGFKQAGKTPEAVAAYIQDAQEGALRDKLTDIALLYARYEARLEGAFIDGEDAQEALLERLPDSGLLDGAQVWVYGFDLIAPQFARQLAVMAKHAQAVRVAITCAARDARDAAVFAPVRESFGLLGRALDACGLVWEETHIEGCPDTASELAHLEGELFATPPVVYGARPRAVRLSIAATPYEEAMQAAAQMLAYARGGIPFDEMAVVVGDAGTYTGAVETAFGRSGIPFHLDRERPAVAHPLIRAWLAGLRAVTTHLRRQEDMLDWLKGGFCGLTAEEAERIENYAIEHGLRGRKWQKPIEDIELEALRVRLLAPLEALHARLREAKDNTASLAAVYGLLEDVDAYGTLAAWQRTLTARGMFTEAAACAQAWRILLETLDQLHALLHGGRMPMDGMAQVIEAGFAAVMLDAVPPKPGMAQVGQLGHAKIGGECRVLFLLGMQDGIFQTSAAPLITDLEAGALEKQRRADGMFGMREDTLSQLKQAALLDTLCAPREALHISHAVAGVKGDALRPAAVLGLIRRVFPALEEEGSAIRQALVSHAPGAALDAMGPLLRAVAAREGAAMAPEEADIVAWLLHAPQTRAQAHMVAQAFAARRPVARLGPRVAGSLYALGRTSVSRLEAYAGCPFRHFVAYGIRPVPRRAFEVARDETGTFYHQAMEGYTRLALTEPDWPDLTRERSDALMDAVLAPLREQWAEAPLGDNAMMRATGDAFCRVARRAAWNYAGQAKRGAFRTGRIEARFGPGEALAPIQLLLPDGRSVWLEGRIDRIDLFERDAQAWLRVVDYKSGGTTLDISRIYGGLQLQLLLYLSAALADNPAIAPAGAFYSKLEDPYILTDSRDMAQIEQALAEKLRLKGIMLSDVQVLRAMDRGDLITKGGEPSKRSREILSEEQMHALMAQAHSMAQDIAGQIAQGEIEPRPAQLGTWRACQWCDYQSVCGFDATIAGFETRKIEKVTMDEVMRRLEEGTR